MISLGDRPGQRRLPLRHKRLAEIIDLAKNLDDPIQHHRLRHSATAAYLKKPSSHNPLIARKPLIRVTNYGWIVGFAHRLIDLAPKPFNMLTSDELTFKMRCYLLLHDIP